MASQLATTRRLLLASAAVIVLVLAALPALAGAHASGYPLTIDVRATAKGDLAMPFNFAVQPKHVVVVRIRNYTRELHTFAIPAIGLNVAVLPGSPQAPRTTQVRFVLPHYGTYNWLCWTCRFGLHHHDAMSGRLYASIPPDLNIGG
jgi:hypothetical protein